MTPPEITPAQKPDLIAAALDLGGTKIEAQVFDAAWSVVARKRVKTPDNYPALLQAISGLMGWIDGQSAQALPIGIGAAGLIDPVSGKALTVNICASGQTLPADIETNLGRPIAYLNDCRAVALSETVFGAGKGHNTVACVVLGTGVGGGVTRGGALPFGPTHTGGEFGHIAASAAIVAQYNLPLVICGCGRTGCVETYLSGPGLERIAQSMTGQTLTSRDIVAARKTQCEMVWKAWCALGADLMRSLVLTLDPDVIVLGGGLSRIDGVIDDLTAATKAAQFDGFDIPPLVLAQGGDTSGARGAAYAAWQTTQ